MSTRAAAKRAVSRSKASQKTRTSSSPARSPYFSTSSSAAQPLKTTAKDVYGSQENVFNRPKRSKTSCEDNQAVESRCISRMLG